MPPRRSAPALVAAVLALLALPAAAHATEPLACLTPASLDNAVEGDPHQLNASCSGDVDGQDIVRYEWDLDGDGVFEVDRGASPSHTQTWADRGALLDARAHVGVRVTDSAGEVGTLVEEIRVTDAINSWFLFEPQIVNPGDTITLSGIVPPSATSTAPYTGRWDLDGDGSYETDGGTSDTVTLQAPETPGFHRLGLEITDGDGITSRVHRQIEVLARHPSRDMIAWAAAENLGTQSTLDVQATTIAEALPLAAAPAPAVDAIPADDPAGATVAPRRPRLSQVRANRNGLSLRYTGGPKWSLWTVVVRLPAKRASTYGLPRRTVVLCRGKLRFDGSGVATAKMRWTRGAYGLFRRIDRGVMDIRARRYR